TIAPVAAVTASAGMPPPAARATGTDDAVRFAVPAEAEYEPETETAPLAQAHDEPVTDTGKDAAAEAVDRPAGEAAPERAAFMPPPPVQAPKPERSEKAPDPYRAAEFVNGSAQPGDRKRGQ